MPANDTITIYQGEDATLSFTMYPVEDITGWTIEFNVRRGDEVKLTASAMVDNGPNGLFHVDLVDDDTDALEGNYLYDVWRTDAGSESVLALGTFLVRRVARTVA